MQESQEEQSMGWKKTSRSSCQHRGQTPTKKVPTNLSSTIDEEGTPCFSTTKMSWPNRQEKESEIKNISNANFNRLLYNQQLAKCEEYTGDKNVSIQKYDGISSQTRNMEQSAPQDDLVTGEHEREDLKSTEISSLQNSSSPELGPTSDEHIGVCEPLFVGHLSSHKRAAEYVCSETNAVCPSLALQIDTVVLRTLLPEIERRVTTRVEKWNTSCWNASGL